MTRKYNEQFVFNIRGFRLKRVLDNPKDDEKYLYKYGIYKIEYSNCPNV